MTNVTQMKRDFDVAVETTIASINDARLIPEQYPISRARTITAALIRRGWTPPTSIHKATNRRREPWMT